MSNFRQETVAGFPSARACAIKDLCLTEFTWDGYMCFLKYIIEIGEGCFLAVRIC